MKITQCIGVLGVLFLITCGSAQTQPMASGTKPPPTDAFFDGVHKVEIDPSGTIYAETDRGLYASDGDLSKWKAVLAYDEHNGNWRLLTVTADSWLFLHAPGNRLGNDDFDIVLMKKGQESRVIARIGSGKAPFESADANPVCVAFLSENTGAYTDGKDLLITNDGGKHWTRNKEPAQLQGSDRPLALFWASPKELVETIQSSRGKTVMFEVDDKASIKTRWVNQEVKANHVALDQKNSFLWMGSHPTVALRTTDGTISRKLPPTGGGSFLTYSEGRLYIYGDRLEGWDLTGDTPVLAVKSKLEPNAVVPKLNGTGAYLFNADKMLDLDADRISPKPIAVDQTAIVLLQEAQQRERAANSPTAEEEREMDDLIMRLGMDFMPIGKELTSLPTYPQMTPRECTQWLIKAMKERLANRVKSPTSAPATVPKGAEYLPTNRFIRIVEDVAILGDKSCVAISSDAIYQADSAPAQWKAVVTFPEAAFGESVGGSKSRCFFLMKTSHNPDEVLQLASLSSTDGYKALKQKTSRPLRPPPPPRQHSQKSNFISVN